MPIRVTLLSLLCAGGTIIGIGPSNSALANDIYVDDQLGDDAFDGRGPTVGGTRLGPVRTLRRALMRAERGDRIVIANNGNPYYESLRLVGGKHSGLPRAPFTIEGNGVILSGARSIPAEAWQSLDGDIWKVTPWKKGHYQLLLDHAAVPEHPCSLNAKSLPKIPEGRWCAWKGSIYYQGKEREGVLRRPFAFAYDDVGISLYHVRNVRIRNLTVRHFRLDGVSAPALVRNLILEKVTAVENGRSGVAIGGTSQVLLNDCDLENNRKSQLIIRGLSSAEVENSRLGDPPTFID